MAEKAVSSEVQLIHYELAGLYSVKAAETPRPQFHLEDEPPPEAIAAKSPRFQARKERS